MGVRGEARGGYELSGSCRTRDTRGRFFPWSYPQLKNSPFFTAVLPIRWGRNLRFSAFIRGRFFSSDLGDLGVLAFEFLANRPRRQIT
jgi:hypothetical protein